jgi:hypothetical protein
MTIMVSTGPPPMPPCSSAKGRPRMPSSANCFQISRLQPSALSRIFLRCLEAVFVAEQTFDAVFEELLLFGKLEIHTSCLSVI